MMIFMDSKKALWYKQFKSLSRELMISKKHSLYRETSKSAMSRMGHIFSTCGIVSSKKPFADCIICPFTIFF